MPSEVRFAEIRKLLEKHGWSLDRIRGSHHVFVKPGHRSIPIPVNKGRVDHHYLEWIKKIIRQADGGEASE
ncbi:MAG: addiction module toxin, HicA family [Phycisphaerales bacterium]|nr:MAG: addiction module toxin, HicA family [Phycisphaerales bacterium]